MIKMEISLMPNTSKLKEHSINDSQVGSMQKVWDKQTNLWSQPIGKGNTQCLMCLLPQARLQGNL